jgi:probable rRNA maturation factor
VSAGPPAGWAPCEIEVTGEEPGSIAGYAPDLHRAAAAALRAAGVRDGHLCIALVGEDQMRELNRQWRGQDVATDVLSFPVDGPGASSGPRELGDVVICPERTADVLEAALHGVLHLCGYDHETDGGEMLRLQDRVLGQLRAG